VYVYGFAVAAFDRMIVSDYHAGFGVCVHNASTLYSIQSNATHSSSIVMPVGMFAVLICHRLTPRHETGASDFVARY
jgi:hypothetical protein